MRLIEGDIFWLRKRRRIAQLIEEMVYIQVDPSLGDVKTHKNVEKFFVGELDGSKNNILTYTIKHGPFNQVAEAVNVSSKIENSELFRLTSTLQFLRVGAGEAY